MKCQKCDNVARQHVTELVNGDPVQYHVCEEHLNDLDSLSELPPKQSPLMRVFEDPGVRKALDDPMAREKVAAWVLPPLCLALADDRAEVRVHAACRLMMLGADAESALEPLRAVAADDSDIRVRMMAEAAIERIESDTSFFF